MNYYYVKIASLADALHMTSADIFSAVLNDRVTSLSVAVVYQKRLKKERRVRKRLQEQLDLEIKRRTQLEEALKATGASSEQVRAITGA